MLEVRWFHLFRHSLSPTPMSRIAGGSSAPAATVTALQWWKEFVSTLRMFSYDDVLSIEQEDSLLSPEEGLAKAAHLLNGIVIKEQPTATWCI